jgi:hypothetical protein
MADPNVKPPGKPVKKPVAVAAKRPLPKKPQAAPKKMIPRKRMIARMPVQTHIDVICRSETLLQDLLFKELSLLPPDFVHVFRNEKSKVNQGQPIKNTVRQVVATHLRYLKANAKMADLKETLAQKKTELVALKQMVDADPEKAYLIYDTNGEKSPEHSIEIIESYITDANAIEAKIQKELKAHEQTINTLAEKVYDAIGQFNQKLQTKNIKLDQKKLMGTFKMLADLAAVVKPRPVEVKA